MDESGERALVVLAGLPGAGKSTALATLGDATAIVLDSDQVRLPLRRALPRVPYRVLRPFVHTVHQARVCRAVLGDAETVVVHDPATRAVTRAWYATLARVRRRRAVFAWLDVTAADALAGQLARGRVVRSASFARHARRAALLVGRLRAGERPRGWDHVVLLDRADVHDPKRSSARILLTASSAATLYASEKVG